MASLTDMLDTLNPDQGTPPAPNNLVVEETPPLSDNDGISAHPTDTACWTAMKALQDNLRQNCGMGATLKLGPVTIDVPATIISIASGAGSSTSPTRDKQVETIMDTNWCKKTAEQIYSSISSFKHDSSSYLTGLMNVERTIAEAVVDEFGQK
jgi:hypothetical protein